MYPNEPGLEYIFRLLPAGRLYPLSSLSMAHGYPPTSRWSTSFTLSAQFLRCTRTYAPGAATCGSTRKMTGVQSVEYWNMHLGFVHVVALPSTLTVTGCVIVSPSKFGERWVRHMILDDVGV